MFSSDNHNNNGVYPVAFLFPPLPSHENDNLAATSLHHLQNCHPNDIFVAHQQFSSSAINTNQMAPATSIDPLMSYKAFWSNNMVMNIANECAFVNDCSEVEVIQEKRPLKKDRHSKIHTAQGLRDRRVRLSIGIAREFFDLQDMLGYDKASKTLEWLLKKSRKAIQELAKAKKHNNGCYNHTNNRDKGYENNCDEEQEEANDNDKDDNKGDDDDEKSFISSSSSECCVDLGNASKRSKAKAKERVKEEAKDKDFENQNEAEERLSTSVHCQNITPLYKQMFEEPNQEFIFTQSNYNSNLPQNWDIYDHNLLGDSSFFSS